jgi:ribosome biogenesis GTPase
MSLQSLGWTPAFARAFQDLNRPDLVPARVVREERERYVVQGEDEARPATLAGRLRHEAARRADLPAVGDWVAVRVNDADSVSTAGVVSVLPRASAFVRRAAGEADQEQVVAANVDTVFLLTGLDGDFNVRRIERYVAAGWDSGATPVVLLTKSCP